MKMGNKIGAVFMELLMWCLFLDRCLFLDSESQLAMQKLKSSNQYDGQRLKHSIRMRHAENAITTNKLHTNYKKIHQMGEDNIDGLHRNQKQIRKFDENVQNDQSEISDLSQSNSPTKANSDDVDVDNEHSETTGDSKMENDEASGDNSGDFSMETTALSNKEMSSGDNAYDATGIASESAQGSGEREEIDKIEKANKYETTTIAQFAEESVVLIQDKFNISLVEKRHDSLTLQWTKHTTLFLSAPVTFLSYTLQVFQQNHSTPLMYTLLLEKQATTEKVRIARLDPQTIYMIRVGIQLKERNQKIFSHPLTAQTKACNAPGSPRLSHFSSEMIAFNWRPPLLRGSTIQIRKYIVRETYSQKVYSTIGAETYFEYTDIKGKLFVKFQIAAVVDYQNTEMKKRWKIETEQSEWSLLSENIFIPMKTCFNRLDQPVIDISHSDLLLKKSKPGEQTLLKEISMSSKFTDDSLRKICESICARDQECNSYTIFKKHYNSDKTSSAMEYLCYGAVKGSTFKLKSNEKYLSGHKIPCHHLLYKNTTILLPFQNDAKIDPCPEHYIYLNGHCYFFERIARKTWPGARLMCRSQGGDLVTIKNYKEQYSLLQLINGTEKLEPLWIGLNNLDFLVAEEGRSREGWSWSDGSTYGFYRAWNDDEPHGNLLVAANGGECVHLSVTNGTGIWADASCSTFQYGYICQRRADAVDIEYGHFAKCGNSAKHHQSWTIWNSYCHFNAERTQNKYAVNKTGASKECKHLNASLISIHNSEHSDAVTSISALARAYWIGLAKNSSTGEWSWDDNSKLQFTKWSSRTGNHSNEHCAVYYPLVDGWVSSECGVAGYSFMCQAPIVCPKGFWGDMCTMECGQCASGWCESTTGKCLDSTSHTKKPRCLPHYVGLSCMTYCYTNESDLVQGPYKQYCYKYFGNESSWEEAEATCQRGGGHLLSIQSNQVASFILGIMGRVRNSQLWIGLIHLDGEMFVWSNSIPVGYRRLQEDWTNDLPSSTDAVCAVMTRKNMWVKKDCSLHIPFICEYGEIISVDACQCTEDAMCVRTAQKFQCISLSKDSEVKQLDALREAGYLSFNGKFYRVIVDSEYEWQESEDMCMEDGAHLIIPETREELAYLLGLVSNLGKAWLGGYLANEPGQTLALPEYEWLDTKTVPYLRSVVMNIEDEGECLDIGNTVSDVEVRNVNCNEKRQVVCELRGQDGMEHDSSSGMENDRSSGMEHDSSTGIKYESSLKKEYKSSSYYDARATPPGYVPFKSKLYRSYGSEMLLTWNETLSVCREHRALPVVPESSDELKYLITLVSGHRAWLGGHLLTSNLGADYKPDKRWVKENANIYLNNVTIHMDGYGQCLEISNGTLPSVKNVICEKRRWAVCQAEAASLASICGRDWTYFPDTGKCYKVLVHKSQTEVAGAARSSCFMQESNALPVYIGSRLEYNFIVNLIQNITKARKNSLLFSLDTKHVLKTRKDTFSHLYAKDGFSPKTSHSNFALTLEGLRNVKPETEVDGVICYGKEQECLPGWFAASDKCFFVKNEIKAPISSAESLRECQEIGGVLPYNLYKEDVQTLFLLRYSNVRAAIFLNGEYANGTYKWFKPSTDVNIRGAKFAKQNGSKLALFQYINGTEISGVSEDDEYEFGLTFCQANAACSGRHWRVYGDEGDSCYKVKKLTRQATWMEASNICVMNGATLALVSSSDSKLLAFIKEWVLELDTPAAFIGAEGTEGKYHWLTTHAEINSSLVEQKSRRPKEQLGLALTVGNRMRQFIAISKRKRFPAQMVCETRSCPSNWIAIGSRCYYSEKKRRTFRQVKRVCHALEGKMVTFETKEKFVALNNSSEFKELDDYWIGLSDKKQEMFSNKNGWLWEDLDVVAKWTSWASNQPDNYGGREDCVHVYDKYKWNDDHCRKKKTTICQMDSPCLNSTLMSQDKTKCFTIKTPDEQLSWSNSKSYGCNLATLDTETDINVILTNMTEKQKKNVNYVYIGTSNPTVGKVLKMEDEKIEHISRSVNSSSPSAANDLFIVCRKTPIKCPRKFYNADGSCYHFLQDISSWKDAIAKCKDLHEKSTLAVLDSTAKQTAAFKQIDKWFNDTYFRKEDLVPLMAEKQSSSFIWTPSAIPVASELNMPGAGVAKGSALVIAFSKSANGLKMVENVDFNIKKGFIACQSKKCTSDCYRAFTVTSTHKDAISHCSTPEVEMIPANVSSSENRDLAVQAITDIFKQGLFAVGGHRKPLKVIRWSSPEAGAEHGDIILPGVMARGEPDNKQDKESVLVISSKDGLMRDVSVSSMVHGTVCTKREKMMENVALPIHGGACKSSVSLLDNKDQLCKRAIDGISSHSPCPLRWVFHDNSCYFIQHGTVSTYNASSEDCRKLGGNLFDDQEHDKDFLFQKLHLAGDYWIAGDSCSGRRVNNITRTFRAKCQEKLHYVCEKDPYLNGWFVTDEVMDSWIELTFSQVYRISKIRIMQSPGKDEQIKMIQLLLDGERKKNVELSARNGSSRYDTSQLGWSEINFSEAMVTSKVKITIKSVYTAIHNGFVEIEVYGEKVGALKRALASISKNCANGWIYNPVNEMCVRIVSFEKKTFADAELYCNSRRGNLISIKTSDVQLNILGLLSTTYDVGSDTYFWIGHMRSPFTEEWSCTDHSQCNGLSDWWYSDDETVTEPDDADSPGGKVDRQDVRCVAVRAYSDKLAWFDRSCSNTTLPFICQSQFGCQAVEDQECHRNAACFKELDSCGCRCQCFKGYLGDGQECFRARACPGHGWFSSSNSSSCFKVMHVPRGAGYTWAYSHYLCRNIHARLAQVTTDTDWGLLTYLSLSADYPGRYFWIGLAGNRSSAENSFTWYWNDRLEGDINLDENLVDRSGFQEPESMLKACSAMHHSEKRLGMWTFRDCNAYTGYICEKSF